MGHGADAPLERGRLHGAGRALGPGQQLPHSVGLLRGRLLDRVDSSDGAVPRPAALLQVRAHRGRRQRLSRLHLFVVVAGALVAVLAVVAIVVFRPAAQWTADVAPAASVVPDHLTTGDKDAIGTAAGRQSNVWFTAPHGTLADVLYPTVDADNLRQFGFLVTDGSSFFFDAATQGVASSRVTDDRAPTYAMQVDDPVHKFSLVTEIATDPDRPVVVVRAHLIGHASNLSVYGYIVPHLGGSGAGQTAFFDGTRGYVSKGGLWLATGGDAMTDQRTAGYLGRGDGYDQLHRDALANRYRQAGPGRVTLTWKLDSAGGSWVTELAFGSSRAAADAQLNATQNTGPQSVFDAYRSGWRQYTAQLSAPPGDAALFFHSVEGIKMAEDKLHPGAIVASPARPWGYSPARRAAEIAALRAGERWESATKQVVDRAVPLHDVIQLWDRSIESWTFVRAGPAGVDYYLRISPDGKPDTAEPLDIANGGGVWDQRFIVDPSFLELVRLGVRKPDDPRIISALRPVDDIAAGKVGLVTLWHRYPHHAYGAKHDGSAPPGLGHLWPLLTGERGVYTVLAGGDGTPYTKELETLAGADQLLGEQVWEGTGLPTGSARPLVWAHAEYIILAKAVATGTVDDRPA